MNRLFFKKKVKLFKSFLIENSDTSLSSTEPQKPKSNTFQKIGDVYHLNGQEYTKEEVMAYCQAYSQENPDMYVRSLFSDDFYYQGVLVPREILQALEDI